MSTDGQVGPGDVWGYCGHLMFVCRGVKKLFHVTLLGIGRKKCAHV